MSSPETAPQPGGVPPDRELRVSDAEREHVGQLLQRAVGLGLLSLGEFTERMDTALAARTRAEINAVLVDLPGVWPTHSTAAAPPKAVHHAPDVGTSGWAPLVPGSSPPVSGSDAVIRGRFAEVRRRGPWHVGPTLQLNTRMSAVELNFTKAIVSTPVVELGIDDYCSSIALIVPAEATVDLNLLEAMGSSVHTAVRAGAPSGSFHVVVRGRSRFGSVTVKYPPAGFWRRR
ncbi:DUF1707 domain-containing protein [Nocardia sp. CNY236]|uniref:DUF1707 SHOCT-like domain-containing protein n=1 Tax=Nocardia sp. CNY236 TaxID=1169152 RepID=UPI001E32F964|nr:DUF1707 domain-containing protein [Nocardia sp. CNY236]